MPLNRYKAMFLTLAVLPLELLASDRSQESLTLAVASNFHTTAEAITARFTEATGIGVRIVAGSTGKLYAQIVNGAPYDVFLSADRERPQLLLENGFAVPDSYFVYAAGQLVLWSNDRGFESRRDCLRAFHTGDYRFLAIANPDTAPYGVAARQVLESENLWSLAENKVVYGENVAQTFHFVASGNATLGLVAESQITSAVRAETTCFIRVDATDHGEGLHQAGVVLAGAPNKTAAQKLRRFIESSEVQTMISRRGYRHPTVPLDIVH